VVPGHVELVNVLWELGILPDIRVLPLHTARPIIPAPTREAAIAGEVARFGGTSGRSGFWESTSNNASGTSWRHASTSSLPPALTALSRAGLRPVAKSSSPGSPTRDRSSLSRRVKYREPQGRGTEPHDSPGLRRTRQWSRRPTACAALRLPAAAEAWR
jgi:hypothetical protein